jgi:hypothetical protein
VAQKFIHIQQVIAIHAESRLLENAGVSENASTQKDFGPL